MVAAVVVAAGVVVVAVVVVVIVVVVVGVGFSGKGRTNPKFQKRTLALRTLSVTAHTTLAVTLRHTCRTNW